FLSSTVFSVNSQCFHKTNADDTQRLQNKFENFNTKTLCNIGNQACIRKDFAQYAQKDTWSIISCPCVEITSIKEYSNESTFPVSQISSAQPLCFSDIAGVKDTRSSSVWYLSPKE
ncbi:10019_t:CDS:2, partial [Scutellospora calospora]